uniref:Ankyrin repeat and SOCS box containing 5a n=1 Tax=Scophthalmus maximus TaxID=52904 RepID=A0A8D3ACC9_SCOMX
MSDPTAELTNNKPFAVRLSNVYLSILALFCFKLFVKISLNLLTYFYIVRGNRKEAARISAEFYDYGQRHGSWADRSPLHDAASQGRLLALRTLILQGHSVNVLTIDHVTPLHEACLGDHVACARALIDCVCLDLIVVFVFHSGANVQKGKSLDSPLHVAAEKDCTAVVKLLLDFGADINARNTEFRRPVDVAPPSSSTEGFLLLYEATPRLLSQLCRQCVRNCVGRDRLHLLSHLPLPTRLRNYLQYQ